MIEIEMLTPKQEASYGKFLLNNSNAFIYATVEYRNFLKAIIKGEPTYLIAVENDSVVGVLPYFSSFNKKYHYIINSLPWYGSHGGCKISLDADCKVRKVLLQKYREIVMNSKVLTGTLILAPEENKYLSEYLEIIKPDFLDKRIGQITLLPDNNGELESNLIMTFKQKTRNLVRKSLKQGFDLVSTNEDWAWEFLYNTHVENIGAIGGKAKLWDHFIALRKYIPENWREINIAMLNGSPVAGLLLLKFNRTIEYFTPVIKHEYRSLQPLSFLIWHGMVKGVKNGFQWWNWGGTWITQESLYHFKAGWGASDYPYTYLINVRDDSLQIIKNNMAEIQEIYPYYYIFPFAQL